MAGLTNKQQAFIDEYLKCWNVTEAYVRVYNPKSREVASANGSRLLGNARISEQIKKRVAENAMSADEVLARTAEIGRGDLAEYVTRYGELDIERLKADGRGHLLKKYKRTKRVIHQKDGGTIETETLEAELYPADAAHEKIMRYHGLYKDKVEHSWRERVPADKQDEVEQFFQEAVKAAAEKLKNVHRN